MKITSKLFETKFSKKIQEKAIIIIEKRKKIYLEKLNRNEKISFDSIGTHREKDICYKAQKFWDIQNTLEDLDKVFIFLQIDRNKILEIYPLIKTQKNYFTYHIENYIVRINTLTDLIGKLGNILYKTGIPDNKCNGYNFKERVKTSNSDIALLMENILVHAKGIKQRRHQKLHTGKLEIDELEGFTIWEDYSSVLKIDLDDPLLKSMTDAGIKNMISGLQKFALDLVEKINLFLENSKNLI